MSNDVVPVLKRIYYILCFGRVKKVYSNSCGGLWTGSDVQDLPHFLAHEPFCFEPLDVIADGSPHGVESLHLVLHGHIILNGWFRKTPLDFDNSTALLLEFFQLGYRRFDGGLIFAGIETKFDSGEKIENCVGKIGMRR